MCDNILLELLRFLSTVSFCVSVPMRYPKLTSGASVLNAM